MAGNTLVNIGVQRFDRLQEQKKFYIDKTDFISEWWEKGSDVTLITRSRRFGKTLNMSMVECFFSCQYADRSDLFDGLSVWEERTPDGSYQYRLLQGTYPVISLTFADIKATEYSTMESKITELFARLYEQNSFLLEGNLLSDAERAYYQNVCFGKVRETLSGNVIKLALHPKHFFEKEKLKIYFFSFFFRFRVTQINRFASV